MEWKTAILGAGIAGIGAAYRLVKNCTLFEAKDSIGGHCGNFMVGGFRFDYAVHFSFTNDAFVRGIFNQVEYYRHFPLAMNFSDGYWTKHPIQNNLFSLPIQEKIDVIRGFVYRSIDDHPQTYADWLKSKYGDYFSSRYPERYTRKYWGYDASELTTNWIENRMYTPSLDEILYGAFTDETPNTYYAKEMRYPKNGGYMAFFEHLCNGMDIRLEHVAVRIDISKKTISFLNGQQFVYERLVSSLPLPNLVTMMENVPEQVKQSASELQATSLVLVSVGFKHVVEFPSLWFYIYDEDIPFARAYSPSMKSPDNAPEGKSSLQFEFYRLRDEALTEIDIVYYKQQALGALARLGIASGCEVEIVDVRSTEYANVIFKPHMEEHSRVGSSLGFKAISSLDC